MTLKVISAEAIVYEGEVTSVTLPGEMGSFTVLQNHASLISTLIAGTVSYAPAETGESNRQEFRIEGGIADIDNNVVSVCIF